MIISRHSISTRPLLLLLVLLLIGSAGCGRKDMPQPATTEASFQWARATAVPELMCLRVDAELEGNLRNVASVVLELQTASDVSDCPGCPFSPNERTEFAPEALGITPSSGGISTLYCPTREALAYRWRLVGTNVHGSLAHALTPVEFVEMR